MPNIPIYIDDSYWRKGDEYDTSAISFLDQCLMDNKALFSIHFNNIKKDIDEDYSNMMSGMEVAQFDPLLELIHKLKDGKGEDEFFIDDKQVYDKRYFTSLPFDENRGIIIFTKNQALDCLQKEYGFGIINKDSFEALKIVTIEKGRIISDIDYTADLKYCNSIIVVDRFVLKSKWSIEKNLYPMLKTIKSNAPMVLSVFSQFQSRSGAPPLQLNPAYTHLLTLCPTNDKWQAEMYDVGERYHDRFIITNNNYITIGGGLDSRELSGMNIVGSKTTTMHKYTYPIFQKGILKEIRFYINALKKIASDKNISKQTNMVKGTQNYLIANWL